MQQNSGFQLNGEVVGHFLPNTAGFHISTPNLPVPWEYIYQNRDVLLKLDQYGPVYSQEKPPSGIHIFKRGTNDKFSPWLVWFVSPEINNGAPFTNFYRPMADATDPSAVPDEFSVEFLPYKAVYRIRVGTLVIETVFFLPVKGCEIVMECSFTNQGKRPIVVKVVPALMPHVNQAVMAPWDKPEWYLKTSISKMNQTVFYTQLLSSDSNASARRTAILRTNSEALQAVEISLERFSGSGTFTCPQEVFTESLSQNIPTKDNYGAWEKESTIYGYPPVYAAEYKYELAEKQTKTLTQIVSIPSQNGSPWLPPKQEVNAAARFFDKEVLQAELAASKSKTDALFKYSRIDTEDEQFDQYVNYWLPLQMEWVASLDRGWPTGMRGTRDSAQDYTALLFTGDFKSCRQVLLAMLECQRSDGWFPRQYSASGRHGKHDLREYVDGGAFVLEYAWQYLAHTGDFSIVKQALPWLDKDEENTVLEHLLQAMDYYIAPENLGKHGLCKLRGGDWLDALNRAGVEGRGETVMVTAQVVACLQYMANLLEYLGEEKKKAIEYKKQSEKLKENIRACALNAEGFFRGTFTDGDAWVFSEKDPDGVSRPYGPSNWYAIIAGVTVGEEAKQVLEKVAAALKGPCGYRLYAPPMGEFGEVPYTGRAGSGDAPAYQGENGNVYNHGSQGFLARAMAAVSEGDALYDALLWLMPYDQEKHPLSQSMAAPYAITNCWQETPAFFGRALMTFLTGSVAMAERGVYEWMIGICPQLGGLCLAPTLPERFETIKTSFQFRGKKILLEIENNNGKIKQESKLSLNGKYISSHRENMFTKKDTFFIAEKELELENQIKIFL